MCNNVVMTIMILSKYVNNYRFTKSSDRLHWLKTNPQCHASHVVHTSNILFYHYFHDIASYCHYNYYAKYNVTLKHTLSE